MEHSLKLLSMAAGLIMTCMVIGFGMLAFRESRKFGAAVLDSVQTMTAEYEEYQWTRYEDCRITGGEVVSIIRKYQDEMPVTVIQGEKSYRYEGSFSPAANLPGTAGYIRFADTYIGKVVRDENEKLCGLQFYLER